MNITKVQGYTGSIERITFILESLVYFIPELSKNKFIVDGCHAWSKDIFIIDNLFHVSIFTPSGCFHYNQIEGLNCFEDEKFAYWQNILIVANECLQGYNNFFYPVMAQSFLSLNKE